MLPTFSSNSVVRIRVIAAICLLLIIASVVPSFGATRYVRWHRWHRRKPVTTTTTTSKPSTTTTAVAPTTKPPVVTTTMQTTVPTTKPPAPTAPTTMPPTQSGFPTASSTGVLANVSLKSWSGSFRSDAVAGTTQVIDGVSYHVVENYLIDIPAGSYFYVAGSNTLIRNVRFVGHGEPSNTGALVQGASGLNLRFENVEVNANGYSRGIQSDGSHLIVTRSKFTNTTDSAVEKNDRNMSSDMTVTDSYISSDCSWVTRDPGSHTDGLQWGGARNVVVKNNTIIIEANMNGCVSNSAIGGWAEIGNVNSAVIDHNLLAGGGATVYMQAKDAFQWSSASFTNNVFDRRYGGAGCTKTKQTSGLWKALYPSGLPAQLTWHSNTFDDGSSVSIDIAKAERGC